ncbi:hypothetical protein [Agrobacterium sp. NPDC089420]|uniref:hypothetical protein n=1 Tax=Agrobacterium sp. NPDC089420 TaxID=3363918 RepID=UPI00384ABDC0
MSEKPSVNPSLSFVPVEACDGVSAATAFEVMRDLYGLHAATAAAWSAIEARRDGDDDRYRFWFGLFCNLRKASPVFSLLPFATPGDTFHIAANSTGRLEALLRSRDVGNVIIHQIRSIVKN